MGLGWMREGYRLIKKLSRIHQFMPPTRLKWVLGMVLKALMYTLVSAVCILIYQVLRSPTGDPDKEMTEYANTSGYLMRKTFSIWSFTLGKETCAIEVLSRGIRLPKRIPAIISEETPDSKDEEEADVENSAGEEFSPHYIFVITPGNPGAVDYYNDFCDAMIKGLRGVRATVLCCSHAGHTFHRDINKQNTRYAANKAFMVSDQIEVRKAILRKVHHSFPNGKIILMGHSMGCYVNIKAMISLEKEDPSVAAAVVYHFQLFPTIQHLDLQWAVMLITQIPEQIASFFGKIRNNEYIKNGIGYVLGSTEALLSLHHGTEEYCYQCAKMGADEYEIINELKKDMIDYIHKITDRSYWIFCASDFYVPAQLLSHFLSQFPRLRHYHYTWESGMSHAFVMGFSHQIAEKVLSVLHENEMIHLPR